MKLFYVDDQLVDLRPNTVIAQTLQTFDPGRMGSVLTNYTSSLRIPITSNNKRIFRNLENSKAKSDIPFSSLSCKYIENGIPIIMNGRVILNEVDEDYSISVFGGPWGFFKIIETRKMWDLDFSGINAQWTQAARDGYRNTTTGIVQALVDDGRLTQNDASTAPTIENQGGVLKPPQIYYHTVVESIFDSAGFAYTGDIFTNDVYKKLALPLSLIYNDPKFIDDKSFFAATGNPNQVIVDPVSPVDVIFDANITQGADNYYDGVSRYVVTNSDTALAFFRMQLFYNLVIEVTGGTVDIRIEMTGYLPEEILNVGSGTYADGFIDSTGYKDGDEARITIQTNSGTPTIEIISGSFYSTPLTGLTLGTDNIFPSIPPDGYIYFEKLFEDINQVDFLKEFCIRFGVQITQVNNVLHVNTLNKILDDTSGQDWTTKRDRVSNSIKYSFSSYGRTNVLKSPVDTEFTPELTSGYGDGRFEIPNENLKESTTLYTSIYSISEMVTTFGVFMLKLNLEPDVAQFARMPGNRLFFVRDNYDFEPSVLYDAIDRTDYKVGYYIDPDQDYSVGWQFFIDTFYQKFVDRCLRRVRLIERFYNLSDLDIYKFDQQVPIWDNQERFLVTKITNRVSGKICKVQLLKIEANPAVTYIENRLDISITDYMERSGEVANVFDYLEQVSAQITNNEPLYTIRMELIENIAGNPTWQTTFDNGTDTEVLSTTGNGSVQIDTIPDASTSVSANVLKTNNDGNGPDGFPIVFGWVEWLKNGVQVHTATFDSSMHSSLWGLNYTFTGCAPGDTLKVVVRENGTTP